MNPTFVVTGANGFIGTHIVERLLKADPRDLGYSGEPHLRVYGSGTRPPEFKIVGTDLEGTLTRNNAQRFMRSARYEFVAHDKLLQFLEGLKEKPEAIVHNGACSYTQETDPEVFRTLNLEYSKSLWRFCAKNGVPLLYASTAGVYGDGSLGFSDKKEDCAKFKPLSLYAKSKHDFDLWALAEKERPPTWFGLRYFNVYGPFESHKGNQVSMVHHLYHQITRTGKARLFKSTDPQYPDGGQLRDFVYVKDITDITFKLLKLSLARKRGESSPALPDNGHFINIGVGKARSFNDLAHAVFESLNVKPVIEYFPMAESLAKQYQNYTCADLSGLKAAHVEHSFTTLEDGVAEYVLRYLVRGL